MQPSGCNCVRKGPTASAVGPFALSLAQLGRMTYLHRGSVTSILTSQSVTQQPEHCVSHAIRRQTRPHLASTRSRHRRPRRNSGLAGLDGGWWKFALLILVPDISLIGYVWGPRVGAALYNAAHSYAAPLMIALVGGALDNRALLLTGSLWIAHIGIDRALGYGLKYSTAFQDTHLGRLGRRAPAAAAVPAAVLRTGEHLAQLMTTDTAHPVAR
jgi:hypothetical protein